jgi:hypothetical protein
MTESRANALIPSPRDGVAVTQLDKKQASTHAIITEGQVQEDKAQNDDDGERGGT